MNSSSAIVKRKLEKSYEVRVKGDGTIFHVGYFRRREDAVLSLKKYEDRLRREKQQCTESSLLKYSQIKTTRDGGHFVMAITLVLLYGQLVHSRRDGIV